MSKFQVIHVDQDNLADTEFFYANIDSDDATVVISQIFNMFVNDGWNIKPHQLEEQEGYVFNFTEISQMTIFGNDDGDQWIIVGMDD